MSRALTALFVVPLLASLVFGVLSVVAAPVMLVIAFVVALPLLLVFRKLRWLNWWHACTAGAVCGSAFTAIYWFSSPPYHIEYIGARTALFFVGFGALIGLAFWWTGIFRNNVFPFVSPRFPRTVLMVVPVAVVGVWLHQRLEPQFVEGRVVAVLVEPELKPERSGAVQLRLRSGSLVEARLPAGGGSLSPVGQCYSLSERWSITQSHKLYFLHAPKFGERSDDC
jgi:hypothetical protein